MLIGSQQIERKSAPMRENIEQEYLSFPGHPVILTDVVTNWPALSKWSFDFFDRNYGNRKILAVDQLIRPSNKFRMKFGTFIKYCQDPSILNGRLRDSSFLYYGFQPFSIDSALMADFEWPTWLDNFYTSLGKDFIDWYLRLFGVLLIGPAGTNTPWHEDLFATHAWLAQIVGRKHFIFYPPVDLARRGSSQNFSTDEYGRPHEAIIEPGEMILFPRGWRHCVTSLDPSISLSFNFVNQTNLAAHMLDTYRNLPAWLQRLDTPEIRRALAMKWTLNDLLAG